MSSNEIVMYCWSGIQIRNKCCASPFSEVASSHNKLKEVLYPEQRNSCIIRENAGGREEVVISK